MAARDALLAELKAALAERDSAVRRQAAHVAQLEQHIRWVYGWGWGAGVRLGYVEGMCDGHTSPASCSNCRARG